MKVTVKTVSDRITILENQKTRSLNEDFQMAVYRWALELKQRAEAAEAIVSDVNEIIGLLSEREWAEHCTKTETGKLLEELITELHDDASPAPALAELVPDGRDLVAEKQNGFYERAIGWNECCAAILRNIEGNPRGQNLPASSVGGVDESQVQPSNEAKSLDEKRVEFIQSLAEDPALLSGKSGLLKYKFDQHWFAVDGCRETGTHYVARLRENGVVTHYAKSLYDFREDGEQ